MKLGKYLKPGDIVYKARTGYLNDVEVSSDVVKSVTRGQLLLRQGVGVFGYKTRFELTSSFAE